MDRRALTRAYKETPRPMGIFRVRNTVNGRALVARSVNLPASLNRERAQLRLGVHRNAALQRDWRTFGPDAFAFDNANPSNGYRYLEPPHRLKTAEPLADP